MDPRKKKGRAYGTALAAVKGHLEETPAVSNDRVDGPQQQKAADLQRAEKDIKLTEIYVNPEQFRYMLDRPTVEELKTSISANGFQGTIILRSLPENKRSKAGRGKIYELVAGHHRFQAVLELKHETIPATVKELNDKQARRVQFDENYVRKDFNPLEEHEALLRIILDETGIREEQLMSDVDIQAKSKSREKELSYDIVGRLETIEGILARYQREDKKRRTAKGFVATLRRLRNLPENIKPYLKKIDYTKLFEVGPIEDDDIRKQLLDWIIEENPSVQEIRTHKKRLLPKSVNNNALETDIETGIKTVLQLYRKSASSLARRKKKKAEKLVAELLALLQD